MARLAYNQILQRPSQLPLDTKHRLVDEEDDSILDDNILDHTSPEIAHAAQSMRRESFAAPSAAFSPRESAWTDFQFNSDPVSVQSASASSHPFPDQSSNNAFVRLESANEQSYANQAATWLPNGSPGSCTPTTAYEGFNADFNVKSDQPPYENDGLPVKHSSMYVGLPMRSGPMFQAGPALATSPQSAQDWMSTSSSDRMEFQAMQKRPRTGSPTYHPNPPLLRRDGIRKKNARFEIPAERTLRTIDHLINQTNDEQEIKELKQQKRLLRNRQAAYVTFCARVFLAGSPANENRLDSRQRKKQHTERLEEEKKHTSTIISELEEALGEMKLRETDWLREKENWMASHQQLQHYIDELTLEKEDLVQRHTIETRDLRQKNAILAEQAQKYEAISMSAVPSSTGYSADFSEFDHLTMESSPWDNFSMVNDFSLGGELKTEAALPDPSEGDKAVPRDDGKTATSGLLLMLLLCGAWVASSNNAAVSAPLPRMPEDVRLASAEVLETIYKDAGIPSQRIVRRNGHAVELKLSNTMPTSVKTTLSASEIASLSSSPLASLHQQLAAPSHAQQREQAFSLSANQYNGISSGDFVDEDRPVVAHRRNLGEALAALRNDKQGSAAEIYTRSLLWNEVPTDVVRDFARMVAECPSDAARRENGDSLG